MIGLVLLHRLEFWRPRITPNPEGSPPSASVISHATPLELGRTKRRSPFAPHMTSQTDAGTDQPEEEIERRQGARIQLSEHLTRPGAVPKLLVTNPGDVGGHIGVLGGLCVAGIGTSCPDLCRIRDAQMKAQPKDLDLQGTKLADWLGLARGNPICCTPVRSQRNEMAKHLF